MTTARSSQMAAVESSWSLATLVFFALWGFLMARMLTNAHRDRRGRECKRGCCTLPGRFTHGGRKSARFRKIARAADKVSWKRIEV